MSDGIQNDNQAAACFFAMRAPNDLRKEWMAEYAIDVDSDIISGDREDQDLNATKARLEALLIRR